MKTLYFTSTILTLLLSFGCASDSIKKNEASAEEPKIDSNEKVQDPFRRISENVDTFRNGDIIRGITPKKKEKKPESDREFLKLTDREMNAIKISLEPGVEICGCIKTSSKDFNAVWATACAVRNGGTDVGVWAIGKNAGFASVTHYTTLISNWGLREDIFLFDDGFLEVYDYAKDMALCK